MIVGIGNCVKNGTRRSSNEMEKVKNVFRTIKSSLIIGFFRVYDAHMSTIFDFERAGECMGEKLQASVAEALDVAGKYYPEEYKHRLRDAVRRGFNR